MESKRTAAAAKRSNSGSPMSELGQGEPNLRNGAMSAVTPIATI
jgi:hypothetical protein